jgi:PAS domain S-box-containing protein
MRVLYVDDEAALLEVGKLFLERDGEFSVDTVLSASAALEMLKNNTFNAIVSDYQMPGMDGIAFLKEVRSRFDNIPFILFTGKGREEVVIQALNGGADFYLQKGGQPTAQFAELSHKIIQAVSRKRAEKELRASRENLVQKHQILTMLHDLGQEFAGLPYGKRVEDLAAKKLCALTGSVVATFNTYDPAQQVIRCTAIELAPGILESLPGAWKEVSGLLGVEPTGVVVPLSRDMYKDINRSIVGKKNTITDISYGKISPLVSAGIQKVSGIDRFFHIAHIIDGELYGTSVIGLRPDRPDPPKELLESFAHMVAVSLRRQRAETALRESEGKFRALADHSLDGIVILDTAGTILFGNKAIEKLTGYDQDILGKVNALSLIAPDFRASAVEDLAQLAAGGDSTLLTYKILKKDNLAIWVECIGKKITYGNGPAVLISMRDITGRRELDYRIRESEASYRGLFNTIRQALYILDREGKFVDVNAGAEKMYGHSRQEFLGRTPEFLSAPGRNDLQAVAEKIQKAFAGEPQEFEFWGLRRNGEVFPKDIFLYKGTYFGEDIVLAVGIDITERRKAENALRESENKFATVFRSNPVTLTLVSATDGRFVDVNDAFVANTGYTREEVIGRRSGEVGIFPDAREYEQLQTRLRSGHPAVRMELHVRQKNGEVRACQFSSGIILMQGRPHILSAVEDITGRKNAELAFQTMTAGMVGMTGMKSLRNITGNISSWLGADCVMIGQIEPDGETVRVLSMLLDGKEVPDYSFPLKDTPCGNVADKGFCLYPDNVTALFPKDRDLAVFNIRGYIGTPLLNSGGKAIGILCALFRHPVTTIPGMQETLNIIAVKAGSEIERQQKDEEIEQKNQRLVIINELEREFAALSTGKSVERLATLKLSSLSGAVVTTFLTYDPTERVLKPAVFEFAPGIRERIPEALKQVSRLLGGSIENIRIPVSEKMHRDMNRSIIGTKKSITELSYGQIQPHVGDAIQKLSGIDRFIHIVHLIDGELYGASVIGLKRDQPDVSQELLESFSHMVAVSLRRQQAETALLESEAKHRILIEESSDPLFTFTREGQYTYANNALARAFGKPVGEIIGRKIGDFFPKEEADKWFAALSQVFRTGVKNEVEGPVRRPDGEGYYLTTITPVKSPSGEVISAICTSIDITERRKAAESLQQVNRKLNLLSGITRHDIKNQLLALNGFLEMSEEYTGDAAKMSEFIDKERKIAKTMERQISFTKEYEEIGVSTPVWQDCRTLIETAAKQALPGKIMVKNDIPSGFEIFADPLIAKVCYNLMDNAVQHGGEISAIRFSVEDRDDAYSVVCEDDGIGVPVKEKELIFERGFGKNTGMGLFLAREILSITGITIREMGEPGKGARFEIRVPKGAGRIITGSE